MKKLVMVLGFMLIVNICFAGATGPIPRYVYGTADTTNINNVANLSIQFSTSDIVYTRSFDIEAGKFFCASYKETDISGSPSLQIQLEQSFVQPTTEGAGDTRWVVPTNMADIESTLTNSTWNHKAVSPVALPYARFKITSSSGSGYLNMYWSQQSETK